MNILITGTSSGIGLGLALEYLERGETVYGISRRSNDELTSYERYHHLGVDLTGHSSVKKKLPEFLSGTNRIDNVILNAGILGEIKWMSEIGVEPMKKVMEINVWANKVLLDLLFEKVNTIKQVVGISSKASLRSTPGWGPYSMSKAGLNMLMNIYAKEYPHTHFTAFAPGLVDSEIQEHIFTIKETDKYPAIKNLQDARNTDKMPGYREAAPMLIEGMKKALDHESGSFVDVREI